MLREVFVLLVFLFLSIQRSALWTSLTLVLISLILILIFTSPLSNSGFIAFLFVLVFIGGLIVILVSIASISHQEQRISLRFFVIRVTAFILFLILSTTKIDWSECIITRIIWFDSSISIVARIRIYTLLMRLTIITWILLIFKGLARRL